MANPSEKNTTTKRFNLKSIVLWIVALVLINVIAYNYFFQIDLTQDKRYTINKSTKKMLKSVNRPVHIQVFLAGDELPKGFKTLSKSTEEIIRRFRDYSNNNISYQMLNPARMDTSALAMMEKNRIFGIPVTVAEGKQGTKQVMVYPFALVQSGDRSIPVLLQESSSPRMNLATINNAEILLEYNIANAINKVTKVNVDSVLYLTGNGEPENYEVFDMANSLSTQYLFQVESLQNIPEIKQNYKAVIINKPTQPFTDLDKIKLDQYLMNGGKMMIAISGANISLDSFSQSPTAMAIPNDVQLTDFLFNLGVRINTNLVQDADNCVDIPLQSENSNQPQLFPWVFFPIVNAATEQPIVKNLNEVLSKFPSSIDLVNDKAAIKKTVLLQTSKYTKMVGTPAQVNIMSALQTPDRLAYKKSNIPIAVLLEGKFNSIFFDRLNAKAADSILNEFPEMKRQSDTTAKVIVISDGNIFTNEVSQQNGPMEMGMYRYSPYKFQNKSLLMNSMEYLTNENNLLAARSKEYQASLLDYKRVEKETTRWQIINIAIPVLLVILFGVVYNFLRRRKYG